MPAPLTRCFSERPHSVVQKRLGWWEGGLLGDGHGHPTTMYIGEGEDLSPNQSMCERLQSVKYNNGGI